MSTPKLLVYPNGMPVGITLAPPRGRRKYALRVSTGRRDTSFHLIGDFMTLWNAAIELRLEYLGWTDDESRATLRSSVWRFCEMYGIKLETRMIHTVTEIAGAPIGPLRE